MTHAYEMLCHLREDLERLRRPTQMTPSDHFMRSTPSISRMDPRMSLRYTHAAQ